MSKPFKAELKSVQINDKVVKLTLEIPRKLAPDELFPKFHSATVDLSGDQLTFELESATPASAEMH